MALPFEFLELDAVRLDGGVAEAVDAAVQHGLSDGVTFAIVSAVDAADARSHRLMARCGFAELGRIAGPVQPIIVYERSV